jgi:hypothetical protein
MLAGADAALAGSRPIGSESNARRKTERGPVAQSHGAEKLDESGSGDPTGVTPSIRNTSLRARDAVRSAGVKPQVP